MDVIITLPLSPPIEIELEESDNGNEFIYSNDEYRITIRKNKLSGVCEIDDLPSSTSISITKKDIQHGLDNSSIVDR